MLFSHLDVSAIFSSFWLILAFLLIVSTYYEGEQMVKPFNMMNVDISCLGNHELDKGLPKGKQLINQTNCPWIISNLLDVADPTWEKPLLDLPQFKIQEHQGFKIGFLGFADEDWFDTFESDIDCSAMKYIDFNKSL